MAKREGVAAPNWRQGQEQHNIKMQQDSYIYT